MRVRDMGRKQQKAVFANLGSNRNSSTRNSDRDKIIEKEFGKKKKSSKGVLYKLKKKVSTFKKSRTIGAKIKRSEKLGVITNIDVRKSFGSLRYILTVKKGKKTNKVTFDSIYLDGRSKDIKTGKKLSFESNDLTNPYTIY